MFKRSTSHRTMARLAAGALGIAVLFGGGARSSVRCRARPSPRPRSPTQVDDPTPAAVGPRGRIRAPAPQRTCGRGIPRPKPSDMPTETAEPVPAPSPEPVEAPAGADDDRDGDELARCAVDRGRACDGFRGTDLRSYGQPGSSGRLRWHARRHQRHDRTGPERRRDAQPLSRCHIPVGRADVDASGSARISTNLLEFGTNSFRVDFIPAGAVDVAGSTPTTIEGRSACAEMTFSADRETAVSGETLVRLTATL